MSYVNYNLPLYRTGFRPYGLTNTWSATQLNGMGQVRPFTEQGGWRLGAVPAHWNWQRSFSPRFLHGMGQVTGDCSGPGGDFVSCSDPTCSYGPCTGAAVAPTECSDASGAFIMCGDANCKFGPCVSIACPAGQVNIQGYCQPDTWGGLPTPVSPARGTYGLAPGSSPRVPASQSMFPPTAASSTIPPKVNCPSGYGVNAQGQCAANVWTQIQPYMPIALVVIAVLALGGSRR